MIKRLVTLFALVACCTCQCVQAQFNRLFTSDNDLPNSLINDVAEGPDEMIWVATEDGLCRFDGSHFTTYRHDPKNPHSLANNFVRSLCADQKGHLLVGSLSGVQMYRPESDDFTPLLTNPSIHVNEGNVNHVLLLQNGDFFASGTNTFTIHIDENGELQAVANPCTNQVMLTQQAAQDAEGNIWVIQENLEIYQLDTHGLVNAVRPKGKRMSFTTIGCDQEGKLYAAGSGSGIYLYDKYRRDFILLTSPDQTFPVRDFCPIPDTHEMYIGTDGEGAKILDCKTGQVVSFSFDDSTIDAATQKVHAIEVSKNGEVWMALYQKGVFEMSRNPLQFHYFGYKSMRYNCIGDRCVTSLLRLHDGTIWVATDNGGLYGINQQGQTFTHYPCTSQPNSVPLSFVNLFEDSKHRVWFGSYGQGGGTIDLKTGRCTYYPVKEKAGNSSNIYAFAEDKRGTLWAASMGSGLMRFDEEHRCFEPIHTENGCDWACALEYDKQKDVLYVGSYNGLSTITFEDSIRGWLSFQDNVIFSITRYDDEELILCTNQGLVVYNPTSRTLRKYTTDEGLPTDNLYAALPDNEGNIWVSSNAGLSKLNLNQIQVTNYTVRDGLQGNEFYKNAAMRDSDGTLWFGGTNGITWFKPLSIYQEIPKYDVRIVNCRSYQGNYFPDAEGTYNFSDDSHAFSVELATRPIMLTSRVLFRYSMDGDRWQTLSPGQNRIAFSHIPAGRHEFRYQAVLDGTSSEVETTEFFIAYHWYQRWWANIIWLSLLALALGMVGLSIKRRIEMRHQMREHKQHEAINEAKLQLFMNISHEFRTPMTLILTPLQKLIATDTDAQRQRSYKLIERNANRILTLINELMDLRKIDAAQMQIQCRPTQIIPLVNDLCSTVTDMAEIRKIDLQVINHLQADTTLMLDSVCFEKILINLLSNALKYTPEGGKITVQTSEGESSKKFPDGCVKIEVTDTGIGIPAEERQHIFDRFYQVRNDISHSVGTGIGLNLVHSLVELQHGEIAVADTPTGKGTSFVVSLPLGARVFKKEEICAEQEEEKKGETEGMYKALKPSSFVIQSLDESDAEKEAGGESITRKLIAVVEDEMEIRKYLMEELAHQYRVKGFANGKEAYEALLTGSFDLVLTDLMMPEMNGEELCQKIRSNIRLNHLPIVMLTARSSDEDRLKGLDIGVNAYLTKPFNVEVMKKTVQNLLANNDRLRNSFSGKQMPSKEVETPAVKSPDELLLERVIKVINDNLDNPELTTDMIAKEIGISRVHLYRKLKELTNQSARNFFRSIRLTKAAEMLASQKKLAIADVAYSVGFANPNNFATAFKELYGMSPTQYMEECKKNPSPSQAGDSIPKINTHKLQ